MMVPVDLLKVEMIEARMGGFSFVVEMLSGLALKLLRREVYILDKNFSGELLLPEPEPESDLV